MDLPLPSSAPSRQTCRPSYATSSARWRPAPATPDAASRRAPPAGLECRARPAPREQVARQALPEPELDAASLVYTKAPQIIRAFDQGLVIQSRRGRFLAIPTENAPRKGTNGRQIKPSTFPEHRLGRLRFVPRPSGPSLLVVEGLRASFSRKSGELRGFRRATDRARARGEGLTTVVMSTAPTTARRRGQGKRPARCAGRPWCQQMRKP